MSIALELRRPSLAVLVAALAACSGGGGEGGTTTGGGGGGAALTVTPTSLAFSIVEKAVNPPSSKSFQVTVNDSTTRYVAAGYPPGTTVPSWLGLSVYGSGTSYTVSASVNTTQLAPATYSTPVRIALLRQDQSVIAMTDVQVTYEVLTGIAIYPNAEQFSYVLGSSVMPYTQTITVRGTTGTSWSATPSDGWVSFTATSGTVPSNTVMSVNPAGLALGSHPSSVSFTGGGVTSTVNLTLAITPPTLDATPTGTVALGGTTGHDPAGKVVQLALTTGTNAYSWSATGAPGWLRLSPSSGTVSATATSVTLSYDPTGLAAGTYTGSVTFAADVQGESVSTSVPVSLTVDAQRLAVSDGAVAFTSLPGLARLTRSLRIRSNRGLTTTWKATTDSPSWLAVTASGTTEDALVLTATPAGLAADTLHRATVTVASDDPTVAGAETVQVGLWIGSAAPAASAAATGAWAEIAADPLRPLVYVNARGTDVTVYDVYSGAVIATIANVGTTLGGMAVSTDGELLFVVDDATSVVVPVDLETRTAGTAWPLASYVPASGTRRDRLAYANVWGSGVVLATDGRAYDAATGAPNVLPYFSGAVLAASRNGARFCGISMGSSPYELHCYPLDRNSTTGALLIGAGSSPSFSDTSGYGYDVGLSEDGSRVYTAAAYPYLAVFDVSASGAVTKAGDFGSPTGYWPIALDIASDGRVACGANNYNSTHAWVYDAAGTLDFDTAVTGLLARGIATSGDGLRLAAIASTALDLFTIGP